MAKRRKIKTSAMDVVSKPVVTMTAGEAFDIAIKDHRLTLNSEWFAMVGWKSPESGHESGPFFVTRHGKTIVEVDRHGVYRESFSSKADCYFPWIGR